MSSLNYVNLCRLCLIKNSASVPIFDDERQILHKITTCRLPIKVSKEDKLPKKICNACTDKVELFYQFWNTTLNTEEQLLQLFGEVGLEDELPYKTEVLYSVMEQDRNNSRLDVVDMYNNKSIITMSATSDEQFTSVTLDANNTFSRQSTENYQEINTHLVEEDKEIQDKESVPSNIPEISEKTLEQTGYNDVKNRMLELTILEAVTLSNFSSYPELMQNPSLYCMQDIPSSVSCLEHVSNTSCDHIPSPTLFPDQISDSSSAPSSCFDKFPDPEFIANSELLPVSVPESEFIPCFIPETELIPKINPEPELIPNTIPSPISKPPSLPFEEPIPSMSTLNVNASAPLNKKGSRKWTIPNKDRPRRFRDQHYCSQCLVGFSDKVKLGKHLVQEHHIDRPFVCDVCGGSFRSALNINRHKRLHDEKAKQFSCEHCDYATNQKSNLTMHIRCRHEKNYTYRCQVCHAGFMQRTKFHEHQALHEGRSIRHACKHCLKTFSYKSNLRQHTSEHHPETIPGPVEPKSCIPCPQCNRMFAKKSLQRHVKAQHSQPNKKFPCDECGALLSCKSALAQHMRSHRGDKVAVCNICGKGFAKWQNLRVHQRMHTGERPYKCTHCSKAFAQKTTLVHHTRIHTGERPYKCDHCGKGYVSGSLLKKHTANCQNTLKEAGLPLNEERSKSEC